MHLRWRGFRRVRRQVCRRLARRLRELELADLAAYREWLEARPAEWRILDSLCRVSVSRFYRDRAVFDFLRDTALPKLAEAARARSERVLRALCAGCASGEEAYTLGSLWQLAVRPRFPGLELRIVAADVDPGLLDRAARGEYPRSSVREFPGAWLGAVFEQTREATGAERFRVRARFRAGIEFRLCDIRETLPPGRFDLILCRNLAFTYFDEPLQRDIVRRLAERSVPAGALVLGKHERLPPDGGAFRPWAAAVYRRLDCAATA
jgi:chemotaxis protein methyltransferase CheR